MSSSRPLVSIILPTYNGSKYLAEAIDSCLAQSCPDWELIIVDDCSQDATPRIIAEYVSRDPRIRAIRHETNQQLPRALNTGHAAARGSCLMWISDDNRLLPRALEELTKYLESNPDVGLVYADSVIIDDQGNYVEDFPAEPPTHLAHRNAVRACFMYRRRVYEAVGAYEPSLFLAEDWDYWLRVYREFEIAPLHKVLYEYRQHPHSLTSRAQQLARATSAEKALRRHLPHLHRSPPQDRFRGWLAVGGTAVLRGAYLQAAEAYLRAIRSAPVFALGYVTRKVLGRIRRMALPGKASAPHA